MNLIPLLQKVVSDINVRQLRYGINYRIEGEDYVLYIDQPFSRDGNSVLTLTLFHPRLVEQMMRDYGRQLIVQRIGVEVEGRGFTIFFDANGRIKLPPVSKPARLLFRVDPDRKIASYRDLLIRSMQESVHSMDINTHEERILHAPYLRLQIKKVIDGISLHVRVSRLDHKPVLFILTRFDGTEIGRTQTTYGKAIFRKLKPGLYRLKVQDTLP